MIKLLTYQKINLLLFLLITQSAICKSQNVVVDSLLLALENMDNQMDRFNTYRRLSQEYQVTDADASVKYGTLALEEALSMGDPQRECGTRIILAGAYQVKGAYDKALEVLEDALVIAEEENFIRENLYIHQYLGNILFFLNRHELALKHYQDIDEKILSNTLQDSLLYQHLYLGNLNNMGNSYFKMKRFDQSLEVYKSLYEQIETKNIVIQKGFKGQVLNNIGNLYKEIGKYSQSIEYLKLAVIDATAQNDSINLSLILRNIGESYRKMKDYKLSEEYLLQSYEYASAANVLMNSISANLALVALYKEQKSYEKALKHQQEYLGLQDSLWNIQLVDKLSEMEVKYETKQKEQAIEIQEKTISTQRWIIAICAGALVIILCLGIMIYIQYRDKNIAYNRLVDKEMESLKIKKEASHALESDGIHSQSNQDTKIDSNKSTEFTELMQFMVEHQPYLEPGLTIDKLSKMLNTNRTYLHQTIKENASQGFNEFINEYRISEAKEMLSQEKFNYLSIEGVANSVGFNSKSPFNKAFKQFTGLTPSFFRKSTQQGHSDLLA